METIKISKYVADGVAQIIRQVRTEIAEVIREKGRSAILKAQDDAHSVTMAAPDAEAFFKADTEGKLAVSAAETAAEKELADTLAALDSADTDATCEVLLFIAAEDKRRAYDAVDQIKGKQFLREAGIVVDGPVVHAEVREQVQRAAAAAARKVYLTALKERRT